MSKKWWQIASTEASSVEALCAWSSKMSYIYIYYICICMSVCLHFSLRPTFWMDAAGFEPAGRGGGYRLEMKNHLQPGTPQNKFGMKIMRAVHVSRQYIVKANRTPASKLAFYYLVSSIIICYHLNVHPLSFINI